MESHTEELQRPVGMTGIRSQVSYRVDRVCFDGWPIGNRGPIASHLAANGLA